MERDDATTTGTSNPEQGKYPMPDASHARNAKARASQMEHQGKLSAADKKKIDIAEALADANVLFELLAIVKSIKKPSVQLLPGMKSEPLI